MKKLVSYCGERVPIIDEETQLPTGEFVQPSGAPIVEGWIDLTEDEAAELESMQSAPPELPAIAAWRFEAAIEIAGIKQQIDDAIDALQEPQRTVAKAKRNRVLEYHRDDPLIAALAPTVGLTSEQIDALWLSAAAL